MEEGNDNDLFGSDDENESSTQIPDKDINDEKDLFGSDSEADDNNEEKEVKKKSNRNADVEEDMPQSMEREEGLFGEEEEQPEEERITYLPPEVLDDCPLPRHPPDSKV